MRLHDRIAAVMAHAGISQRGLSRRLPSLGWHRAVSWVREALQGRHRVPPGKLQVLARSLDTTLLELMGCVDREDLPYAPTFRFPYGELTRENILAVGGHGCRMTLLVSPTLLQRALRIAAVLPGMSVERIDRLPPDMWIAIPLAYDPNEREHELPSPGEKDVVPF